jgi:hypothetical protein
MALPPCNGIQIVFCSVSTRYCVWISFIKPCKRYTVAYCPCTAAGAKLCTSPTSLALEQKENMYYILRKPKTLPIQELRQRATKYCRSEMMLKVWPVHASLSAPPSTPLIPLRFTSNGRGTHRFAPTTVLISLFLFVTVNSVFVTSNLSTSNLVSWNIYSGVWFTIF